jgi:hypothetical protein
MKMWIAATAVSVIDSIQQQPDLRGLTVLEESRGVSASITQQQAELLRPRAELMTAAAHPTPVLTKIAVSGQFFAQAPHSMHASRCSILTMPLLRPKTAWGHTVRHMPHPVHFSLSIVNVATFLR